MFAFERIQLEYSPSTVNVTCETHTSVHLINLTASHRSVDESDLETSHTVVASRLPMKSASAAVQEEQLQ